jgi:hypothetical protein
MIGVEYYRQDLELEPQPARGFDSPEVRRDFDNTPELLAATLGLGGVAVLAIEKHEPGGLRGLEEYNEPFAAEAAAEAVDIDAEWAQFNNELLSTQAREHMAGAAIMFASEREYARDNLELAA